MRALCNFKVIAKFVRPEAYVLACLEGPVGVAAALLPHFSSIYGIVEYTTHTHTANNNPRNENLCSADSVVFDDITVNVHRDMHIERCNLCCANACTIMNPR